MKRMLPNEYKEWMHDDMTTLMHQEFLTIWTIVFIMLTLIDILCQVIL